MNTSPNNWDQKTFGEFISIKRGYDLTSQQRKTGNVPVFGAAGHNGYHNESKVKAPGIVIGRSGGSFGQVHFATKDFWPHNTAMYVTDFKGNDPYFAFYLLKLLDFSALNSGSAQPSLNRNFLYPVKVRTPKPCVQAKIGKLLRNLDEKIELNNKINAELEAMAKLIYDYWFVQFDFPDANGKPYKSSGGKMVYNEELKREIPEEGWDCGYIDEECTVKNGFAFKSESYTNTGYTIVRTKNFVRGSVELGDMAYISHDEAKKFERYNLNKFDFLLVMVGASVGKNVVVNSNILPALQNQNMWCFRSKHSVQHFTNQLLKRIVIEQLSTSSGSAREFFKKASFKESKFANPDLSLKRLFCEKVESVFDRIDIIKNENQKLIELRDWLLPMLMNGQVTVK